MSPIVTRVAHAGFTDHRFFGEAVFEGLLGRETATGLLAMAVLGRRPTDEEREVLDALAVSLTVADPRIWPLKMARVVASYGDLLAGYAAAQLTMMGTYASPRLIGRAAEHLAELRAALAARADPGAVLREHIARHERLVGFGVPMRAEDERLVALGGWLERKGRAGLPHWSALAALSEVMWREQKLRPNISIGLPAAMLDLGLSPEHCGALGIFLIEHTFMASVVEGARQRDPGLQRLPAGCVRYAGAPARVSPRASAAERGPRGPEPERPRRASAS